MTKAVELAQVASTGVSEAFKNRIINGAMVIDQRNAGASVTNNGTITQYSLDRWNVTTNVSSKFTVQQNAGSVTPPAGFRNYLGVTSTAATSVGSSDYYMIRQQIEGFNTADFNYGTANAQTVTLSFWVRSSLTGQFGGALTNDSDAWCPFSYTISSANTWEYKTITIVGATTGTWNTTNGQGLSIRFSLGIGSSFTGGTSGVWSSSIFSQPAGSTSVVGTNGATFYITGVQLEVGSSATSFEYRPYGTELMLCQRYCYQALGRDTGSTSSDWAGCGQSVTTALNLTPILLPVTMRSASGQSVSLTSSIGNYFALNGQGQAITATNIYLDTPSVRCPVIGTSVASGLTVGQAGAAYTSNSSNKLFITSEL